MESFPCVCSTCGATIFCDFALQAHCCVINRRTVKNPVDFTDPRRNLGPSVNPTHDENCNPFLPMASKIDKHSIDAVDSLTKQIKQFSLDQQTCKQDNRTSRFKGRTSTSTCDHMLYTRCTECGKLVMNKDRRFHQHVKSICEKCGREFGSLRSKNYHDFMKHSNIRGIVRCQVCGKPHCSSAALKDHLKYMHNEHDKN